MVFPIINPMQYIKLKRKAEEVDLFSEEDVGQSGTQMIFANRFKDYLITSMLQSNHKTKGAIEMYLRILKKDLKRKRAMNVILLVFIILASMFMSSGVSNIIAVTTALDSYFEMSDIPDYWAMSENKSSDKDICGTLENASAIDEFRIEEFVRMPQSDITRAGEPLNDSNVIQ